MMKKILVGVATVSVLLSSNAMACKCKSNFNSCANKISVEQTTTDKVIKAVSQVGLSAAQTKKIAQGIAAYERETAKIKDMRIFPVDSFMNDDFNEKKFIGEMSEKYIAAIAARATLFKYTFTVLTKDQGKAFKNAYAAPMIEKMIKMHY